MIEGTLLFLLVFVFVIAYFAVPRGTTQGRSALLPGQTLTITQTSSAPVLCFIPETTVRWRGRKWTFALVQLPSGVCRAYILRHPPYGPRATGLSATHRLQDPSGRMYACWTPEPTTPDQMVSILALWIAASTQYIETGEFPTATAARAELGRP